MASASDRGAERFEAQCGRSGHAEREPDNRDGTLGDAASGAGAARVTPAAPTCPGSPPPHVPGPRTPDPPASQGPQTDESREPRPESANPDMDEDWVDRLLENYD